MKTEPSKGSRSRSKRSHVQSGLMCETLLEAICEGSTHEQGAGRGFLRTCIFFSRMGSTVWRAREVRSLAGTEAHRVLKESI